MFVSGDTKCGSRPKLGDISSVCEKKREVNRDIDKEIEIEQVWAVVQSKE